MCRKQNSIREHQQAKDSQISTAPLPSEQSFRASEPLTSAKEQVKHFQPGPKPRIHPNLDFRKPINRPLRFQVPR